MDKENTHRQSSKPKEKNEEREVMTEREDGRKEIEEMSARKEEHFHPSIRGCCQRLERNGVLIERYCC
ncbi:hypothetical protein ACSBR1_008215 [Camellia fascicularis]